MQSDMPATVKDLLVGQPCAEVQRTWGVEGVWGSACGFGAGSHEASVVRVEVRDGAGRMCRAEEFVPHPEGCKAL